MNSLLNLFIFILVTVLYYLKIKPIITIASMQSDEAIKKYSGALNTSLVIYLLLNILFQFIVNVAYISNKCGGSIKDNIGPAGLSTFFPWFFMFGAIIILILVFPSLKGGFADVFGYFYISSAANKLLGDLLIDKDIQDKIDVVGNNNQEKKALEDAANAIVKICGNPSIIINQIVPSNFESYWDILTPLMKPEYKTDNSKNVEMKEKLFKLVVSRDNVGESFWFIYTGILVVSLVSLNINTRNCYVSPKQMESDYQNFLKEEEQAEQKKQSVSNQVYTIT